MQPTFQPRYTDEFPCMTDPEQRAKFARSQATHVFSKTLVLYLQGFFPLTEKQNKTIQNSLAPP